jgi:hypothetical protein
VLRGRAGNQRQLGDVLADTVLEELEIVPRQVNNWTTLPIAYDDIDDDG